MTKKLVFLNIIFGLFTASNIFLIQLGPVNLTLFRITLLMIMIFMIFKFFYKNYNGVITISKNNNFLISFLLIWFLWGILSIVWVKDYNYWLETITHLSLGIILTFIYSQFFKKRSDYILAIRLYSVMILFHNFIGWYEILTKNYMFYSGVSIYWYQKDGMPVSSFGNTNDFATFLFLSLSILYVCLKSTNKLLGKIFYIGLILSSSYLMIATSSRGAILGGILSLSAFIIFNITGTMSKNKLTKFFLLLTGLSITLLILKPEMFINLFNYLTNGIDISKYIPKDLNDIRFRLIINGLYFLVRTFGFGVGAGNAQYWLANESIVPNGNILYLHNWFLEILVEYGIIIFLMYIIFYYKILKTNYKIFRKSENDFDINFSLSIMIFMAGFIIVSFSSHSLVYHEWFWIYWAIVVSFQQNILTSKNYS